MNKRFDLIVIIRQSIFSSTLKLLTRCGELSMRRLPSR